jgi:arginyl-tRNA synthetase
LAWQKFGKGETPESAGMKSDHFVGKYYVEFDKRAKENPSLLDEAQAMLVKWEQGDKDVLALWEKMNAWCYAGFEQTFEALGVDFEKHYKESDYYERGKELVEDGLKTEAFYRKDDQSVWVDLEDKGLDHKLLLRGDGTSVYITQDMGIAEARYLDYHFDESIYVVASEQDYHFKVLQLVLEKLGKEYAQGIYHLSYGLVNLPDGRMKSREGTVVDADDLIATMIQTAEEHTNELGKVDDFTQEEAQQLYRDLALGALKYFILKVNPKRTVIFNPQESIDFQGNTGPFIQFNYVRIQSLLRKQTVGDIDFKSITLQTEEKDLLKEIHKFPQVIAQAAKNYDVSEICSYAYSLAKLYSKFYSNTTILGDTPENSKNFRLSLSKWTAEVLKQACELLGIAMPTRM